MKSLNPKFLVLVLLLLVALPTGVGFAQAPDSRGASLASAEDKDSSTKPDTRSAKVLFEEADSYLARRYLEFNSERLE